MTDQIRCVTYSRISLDATGAGLGVSRQSEANRKLARDRDWNIVHEYVDNDISATDKRKIRPAYNEMLEAYNRGEFDALVCWDLDRLTRQPRQLEDWIDAAEARGLRLVTANGEADLTTDGGRLFARIKAAVSRAEVERKGARQKAAHAQRVAGGHVWKGGRRAFGYQRDMTHNPREAPAAQKMYDDFLAGVSLTHIADWLNTSGYSTTMGKLWTPSTVSQFIQNPKNAGFLAYQETVTGPGQWEPMVDEDKWRTATTLLATRRHTRPRATPHLLSSIAECGLCGASLHVTYRLNSHRRVYRCTDCSRISRAADALDDYITAVTVEWLSQPSARDLLVDTNAPDTERLQDEARMLRLRLEQMAEAFADNAISVKEWMAGRDRVQANLEVTESQLVLNTSARVLSPLVTAQNPEAVWDELTIDRKRAVIKALFTITVNPTTKGALFCREDITIAIRKTSAP